jgi:hypothetical protein
MFKHYDALILKCYENSDNYMVLFLKRSSGNSFIFPEESKKKR